MVHATFKHIYYIFDFFYELTENRNYVDTCAPEIELHENIWTKMFPLSGGESILGPLTWWLQSWCGGNLRTSDLREYIYIFSRILYTKHYLFEYQYVKQQCVFSLPQWYVSLRTTRIAIYKNLCQWSLPLNPEPKHACVMATEIFPVYEIQLWKWSQTSSCGHKRIDPSYW